MSQKISLLTKICLTTLIAYYIFSILTLLLSQSKYLLVLNPKKAPLDNLGAFFQKNDSEFLWRLLTEKPNIPHSEKNQIFKNLFLADPQNKQVAFSYLIFLYEYDKKNYFSNIKPIITTYFTQSVDEKITQALTLAQEKSLEDSFHIAMSQMPSHGTRTIQQDFAKAFYMFGAKKLNTDNPLFTFELWHLSSLMDPATSYYAAETASLAHTILFDQKNAEEILSRCTRHTSARNHCNELLTMLKNSGETLNPGFFHDDIKKL